MKREEQINRLRAEAEAIEACRHQLSEELTQELSTFRLQDILHVFFSRGEAQKADMVKARIAVLEKEAGLYASRILALEDGPEAPPPPAADMVIDAGRAALEHLEAIEANVHEMDWNGTGRIGRQSFGRMKQQRLAKENTEALLPLLNLFYAGFTELTGEKADIMTLLDWYFKGLFAGVWVFDGTETAKEAIAFGRERLNEDIKTLLVLQQEER